MTTEIPDDVVERALAEWFRMPASEARYLPYAHTMRAALRVAVEWEREQCARVADAHAAAARLPPGHELQSCLDGWPALAVAAAIRSRKD